MRTTIAVKNLFAQKILERFNYSIYLNEKNNEEEKQVEEDLYILEAVNDTNDIDCYIEKD